MAFEKVTVPSEFLDNSACYAGSEAAAAVRRTIPAGARIGYWVASDGWKLRRFDWPAANPRGRLLFQT
ncbi:hypothetical protein WH87_14375, partial [Devosia epidermidihirudinis]